MSWRETRRRHYLRALLRQRYGDNCCWCGQAMDFDFTDEHPVAASIEHLIPKWRGGADDVSNMMLAHIACNQARNDEDIARYRNTQTKDAA